MNGGVLGMVAAGSRKLAAQIVVSVIATGCAAVAVPQILSGLGYGEKPQTTVQRPLVAAPVDFEAAFVWPVATPPGVPANLLRPTVPEPSAAPTVAPLPPARPSLAMARSCAPRCAPPRTASQTQPAASAAPLELAAMIAPPAPAAAAPRRTLLGIPVPKLPYEDQVVDTLARAGGAVRSLF